MLSCEPLSHFHPSPVKEMEKSNHFQPLYTLRFHEGLFTPNTNGRVLKVFTKVYCVHWTNFSSMSCESGFIISVVKTPLRKWISRKGWDAHSMTCVNREKSILLSFVYKHWQLFYMSGLEYHNKYNWVGRNYPHFSGKSYLLIQA